MTDETRREVEAVWRIEGIRIVASVAKMTGDLGLAEDVAHDAVLEALRAWPATGVPSNPGAWLTAVAKRRAIDSWRRRGALDDRYRQIAHSLDAASDDEWMPIDDDVLRLVFTACHPVLSRESQVALTLRVVAGLSTDEIARMMLTSVPTVQARITRAKKSLAAANVPFETPDPSEWKARLTAVLGVIYLVFTEGYAATGGDRWVRPDLADEAIRLGRTVSVLLPHEPEPLALVALMEFQRSRFAAREERDGTPVLLADQDRRRWDHGQIARANLLLARADAAAAARHVGRGAYALQAAIAQCHAIAPSVQETDWARIVLLYDVLGRIAPNPIVELNRAVAVSMASGPAEALAIVDALEQSGALPGSHLVPSVRGELLSRLGRADEARSELLTAAALTANEAQRQVLTAKADALRG
ncbi:RNA polymerase sigma factor [Microbacterium lacus]|uniref:Sigma-70 family RNA polymerase sigma factor n=1 Tax=Microbacterium lacus TaxID=415217 RepID=A0ABN2FYM6_9MICO